MQGLFLSDRHRSNTMDAEKKKLFVRALLCAVRPEPPHPFPPQLVSPARSSPTSTALTSATTRFAVRPLGLGFWFRVFRAVSARRCGFSFGLWASFKIGG